MDEFVEFKLFVDDKFHSTIVRTTDYLDEYIKSFKVTWITETKEYAIVDYIKKIDETYYIYSYYLNTLRDKKINQILNGPKKES